MTHLLLDTHVLLWWLSGDARLGVRLRKELLREELGVLVSAASAFEIATKHRLGKLALPDGFLDRLPHELRRQRIGVLDVSLVHAVRAGRFPVEHRDPFDRILAAQAVVEGLPIASADAALDAFGVERLRP